MEYALSKAKVYDIINISAIENYRFDKLNPSNL